MYLFITDPFLRGPAVKRLQEMLLCCGYTIGKCGVDGVYGKDTMRAVIRYQTDKGLYPNGVSDYQVWRLIEEDVISEGTSVDLQEHKTGAGVIVDITKEHKKPKLYRKSRSPRSWKDIEGVTIHQTACNLSDSPKRWYSLNAHIGVLKDGTILIVNDLEDFIWHAQGFSHTTIGIEFNGNFWGVGSDISTWWAAGGEASFLTSGQYTAARVLLGWLKKQFSANGAEFKRVYAHRQSSGSRRSDPGSEIWKMVAMPWIEALGATDGGPMFKYGSGRPIPKQWNEKYTADY